MENTLNIRTQTLIWHDMENQINWADEYCFRWYSSTYIARLHKGYLALGKFKMYEGENVISFESGEYVYELDEVLEFAEVGD